MVQGYINASASQATVVLGNHGSGKSYVLFEVINGIHSRNRRDNKLQIYIAEGDKLSLYENSSKNSLDNIETTISLPIRWGIGIDIAASVSPQKNDSQFNQICNLLKKRFSSDLLICLPDYSNIDNKVKYLIDLLIKNITNLERTFKHHLYFLISNVDDSCINDFLSCPTIEKNILEDYDENDILRYLTDKHKIIIQKNDIEEKIKQIKKICASNLKLVDFKTDYVGKAEDAKEKILEKYRMQLEIYQKALEQSLGKKVSKASLCLANANWEETICQFRDVSSN